MHATPGKKKKILSTVLRVGVLALAGIVLGVNVYLWNARSLVGNSMPMPFGYGCAVVLSGSMEPTLMVDDLIFVKQQDAYEVNDIVVFQDGASMTVHRLIALEGDRVITKGDANNAADEPIRQDLIVGAVCGRIPVVGALARVLKTPLGLVTMLGGALLLAEMSYRNERKEGEEAVEQLKEEIRRLRAEQNQGADSGDELP